MICSKDTRNGQKISLQSTRTKRKNTRFTSLAVALQWKTLVIPLWMSTDLPSNAKTDERTVHKSLCAEAVQDLSPPSWRLLTEWCDPIDSKISDTASWRAQIRCLSHKGCVNCKNITLSKNYERTVEINVKLLGLSHFIFCNVLTFSWFQLNDTPCKHSFHEKA